MDRLKFTTIAHQDHVFYSPLSEVKANRLIDLLDFTASLPVLDIGCGRAELLIRICERHGVQGIGIDTNPTFIQVARANAQARLAPGQATFVEQLASDYATPPASFSGVICTGSSHAYGTYLDTLKACATLLCPGGFALVGDGYWQREPHPDYLAFLGAAPDEMGTHAQNLETALEAGFVPLYTTTSNQDEWDEYEGLYCRAVQRYIQANLDDSDTPAMRERINQWHSMYLQHGRSILGFGFYLLQKP